MKPREGPGEARTNFCGISCSRVMCSGGALTMDLTRERALTNINVSIKCNHVSALDLAHISPLGRPSGNIQ